MSDLMSDPEDAGLTDLLQGPPLSIADEAQAFATIVAGARTRVRRRRLSIVGAVLVAVVLVGSAVAVARRNDGSVQVRTTHHLSADDVTFAVFTRPATPADAVTNLPANHGGFFSPDPKVGARLAIRSGAERVYVYGALRSCRTSQQCVGERTPGGEYYCVALVQVSLSTTKCAQAADFAELGADYGSVSTDGSAGRGVTYGIVPDFVTHISYRGRDVPIVNNAFLVDGDDTATLIFSTPDGDKTALTATPTTTVAPTSTTTASTGPPATAPGSTARTVLAPATAPPVSDECTLPIRHLQDGNVTPLLCPSGGVNTNAWRQYVAGRVGADFILRTSKTLQIGRSATASAVYQAMCSDYTNLYSTNPLTMSAETLGAAYYGWRFTDARITTFLAQDCPAP